MPFGPGLQPGEPPLLNRPTVAATRIGLRPVVDPATELMCVGADDGTRTRNLRFTKPLLPQLSYVGATRRVTPQSTRRAPGNDRAPRPSGSSVGGPPAGGSRLRWFGGSGPPGRRSSASAPRFCLREGSGCGSRWVRKRRRRVQRRRLRARRRPLRAAPAPRGPRRGRVPGWVALGNGLEQEDRARDGGVERPDRTAHRDPHEGVASAAHSRAETLALAADDQCERSTKVRLASGQRRVLLGSTDAQAAGCGGPPVRPAGRRPGTAAGARRRPPRP